jgi:hypothetical protein
MKFKIREAEFELGVRAIASCVPRTEGPCRSPVMDIPSAREVELEMLLRQRETQLAELTVSLIYIPSIERN